jgi:hypothetical protein
MEREIAAHPAKQTLECRKLRSSIAGIHRYTREVKTALLGARFNCALNQNPSQQRHAKKSGEPGRTRTSNPLLKRQLLYH